MAASLTVPSADPSFNTLLPAASHIVLGDDAIGQKFLSKEVDANEHAAYMESLSMSDRATLHSEMLPGANSVLEARPSREPRMKWQPEDFVVELRHRLLSLAYPRDS